MRRHKRKMVPEINLTPLLDVLFSILFIVMMTGMQKEKKMEQDYKEQNIQITQKMADLEKELDDTRKQLDENEKQLSSYDFFNREAVIITVYNEKKDGNHYLVIRQGQKDDAAEEIILLGAERMENVKERLKEMVAGFIAEKEKRPIYIVFFCDKNDIYTIEYKGIDETFQNLQKTKKEVFYKVADESESQIVK